MLSNPDGYRDEKSTSLKMRGRPAQDDIKTGTKFVNLYKIANQHFLFHIHDHNGRATTTTTVVVLRLQQSWYCDCNGHEKTRADSFESTPEYNFTVKLHNLIS